MIWELLAALIEPSDYAVRYDRDTGEFYIDEIATLEANGQRVRDPSRFASTE